MSGSDGTRLVRAMPWIARASWVVVAIAGSGALDQATSERSDTAGVVVTTAAGFLWLAGVAALAVHAVITLTLARVVIPISIPSSIILLFAGASAWEGGITLVAALISTFAVMSGEFGDAYVAASAYGDERRHLLRAPVGFGAAGVIAWLLCTTAILAGVLLLAASSWIAGALLLALGAGLTALAWPRWHLLSRRWLVMVPAGVVLHDPLLLAETIMLRRSEIRSVGLAPVGTEALDLTGPAGGHVVEVATHQLVTAVLAPDRRRGPPRPVHLRAYLTAPTRPGRALASVDDRLRPHDGR